MAQPTVNWPEGRRFAFTIFDDTDFATRPRVKPIYDLLLNLNMRATKSVWVTAGTRAGFNAGSTCDDPDYVEWLLALQRDGFEIALHNVAPGTSNAAEIRAGLARFHQLFGDGMFAHANHVGCNDGIYWGAARFGGWRRAAYALLTGDQSAHRGHIEGDELFWGDQCKRHVRYVRNFVFPSLNTLARCPQMPYHDPSRPWVNFWFAGSDGGSRRDFLDNFTFEAIDRLESEGGLCIAYVHFGAGFTRDGEVDREVRARLEYVASKAGWFPSVSDALDHLRAGAAPGDRCIAPDELRRLETSWLLSKTRQELRRRLRDRMGRGAASGEPA
jgi:hypothetical protein